MKYYALFAALLLAGGCKIQVESPQSNNAATANAQSIYTPTPSTTATTGETSATAASTAGSTSGSSANATSASNKPASPQSKPGYNPDRIHQLSDIKTATITLNGHDLKAWVANTEGLRQEGLMFVRDKDMTDDQAMIFAFPTAKEQGFWMKHTYIPLDIVYVGADKKVVSMATMKPFDETNVPSHGNSMYVIELKAGTVARLGVQKGQAVGIPASVKALDEEPSAPMGGSLGGP